MTSWEQICWLRRVARWIKVIAITTLISTSFMIIMGSSSWIAFILLVCGICLTFEQWFIQRVAARMQWQLMEDSWNVSRMDDDDYDG